MAKLKDISEKLGLSITTVSRVLNEDPAFKVKDETRKKIIKTAHSMGYKPTARVTYKESVGVVLWDQANRLDTHPYFREITEGITAHAKKLKIGVKHAFKDEHHQFDLSNLQGVSALVCIGKFTRKEISQFEAITQTIVFVDSSPNEQRFSSVVIDFKRAVQHILDFITSKQYQTIAYIGGYEQVNEQTLYGERRKVYLMQALKDKENYDKDLVKIGDFSAESGHRLMKKIIDKRIPSVVFCANDSIAFGALKACHELHIKVPEDMAVIGFNDNENAKDFSPPLTTLHVPTKKMGREALKSALELKDDQLPVKKYIPTKIIIRQST